MKKLSFVMLLVFCSFILMACQSQREQMILLDDIQDVSISNSDGYGGMNEDFFMAIDGEEAIEDFEQILKDAKGKSLNVDIVEGKPDYDVLIRYENGESHGLHLLLGDTGEESVVMYAGHEKNGYYISPEKTNELRALLEVQ